ncbi:ribosome biogenesis protein [Candidatus Woesearchaeota archaeon]|nr:ribosome biogenesis protein [Candidatus Woesearchaeota archaeon]
MRHILKCTKCGAFTMKDKCDCGAKAVNPKPAKYNPEDPYADYRRKAKKELEKKE